LVSLAGSATRAPADGPGARTGTWQAPTILFSASPADNPSTVARPTVAFDGHGRATAVWSYSSGARQEDVLMEADWSSAAGWTPARTLTSLGTDVSRPPTLAVDSRGDAVMAWIAANDQLRIAYRSAGEAWQRPRTLSLPGDSASCPQVGIDDHGRSLAMWDAARPSSSEYQFSWKVAARSRSGVWWKPKVVCACEGFGSLAMNASGFALVVWSPVTGGGLWAKTRAPSGRWSAPQRISPFGTALQYMSLALNSRGAAVVSWVAAKPSTETEPLTVAITAANGRFRRPQTIGSDGYFGFNVGIAPSGEAVLLSTDYKCCLYTAAKSAGASSFSAKQTLDSGIWTAATGPLSMDTHGDTLALWSRVNETTNGHIYGDVYAHASQRPTGGTFDSGTDIGRIGPYDDKFSGCGAAPDLAASPDGRLALAVWGARTDEFAGPCTAIEAATFTR
jgi:hypothetical protein